MSRQDAADSILAAILVAQQDDVDVADIALAAALEKLAGATGQNRFRHAAQIVRGRQLGRKAIDDQAALRRIASFPPARRHEAVGVVAQQIAGPGATEARLTAIAQRLRRKMREINERNSSVRRLDRV